jgi:hypothetical protein
VKAKATVTHTDRKKQASKQQCRKRLTKGDYMHSRIKAILEDDDTAFIHPDEDNICFTLKQEGGVTKAFIHEVMDDELCYNEQIAVCAYTVELKRRKKQLVTELLRLERILTKLS